MAIINLIILLIIMRDREKEQSNVIAVSPEGGDCPPDHQTYLSPLFMSTFLLSSSSSLLSSSYVIIIMINEASSSRHCHPRDYHCNHQVPQASERSTCCLNHWQKHHSAEVLLLLVVVIHPLFHGDDHDQHPPQDQIIIIIIIIIIITVQLFLPQKFSCCSGRWDFLVLRLSQDFATRPCFGSGQRFHEKGCWW